MLKLILNQNQIYDFGICSFSDISKLIECRAKLRIPQNPKSVITCIFPYYNGEYENRNLSKYAIVPDYHIVIGDILNAVCIKLKKIYPNNEFVYFVDNSPIPEIEVAVKSGLGFKGKNNLLITKKYGSFVFIGEIVTDKHYEKSEPSYENCLNCGLCIKKCPDNCLSLNKNDFSKCLSHITQLKKTLDDNQIELMVKNNTAWGCDICQDVCPHNKNIQKTHIKQFQSGVYPTLTYDIINEHMDSRAYGYKGAKTLKRNLDILNGVYQNQNLGD